MHQAWSRGIFAESTGTATLCCSCAHQRRSQHGSDKQGAKTPAASWASLEIVLKRALHCCRELQQAWSKDTFLKSGGTAKNSRRRSENFSELFAACHAAEDRLKGLTLKHSRAVKASGPRQQQENVVPTAKRRDSLR